MRLKKTSHFTKTLAGVSLYLGASRFSKVVFQPSCCGHVKRPVNICIETSGFTLWSNFEKVLRYTDFVLYDIKVMNVEKHQKFTGVKNEIILQNALRLAESATSVNFRMPLIPEHNDDEVNIAETAEFLKRAADVKKTEPWIHILPYHRLGVNKYEQLGKNYTLTGLQAPSKESVSKVCEEFRRYGVKTAGENN